MPVQIAQPLIADRSDDDLTALAARVRQERGAFDDLARRVRGRVVAWARRLLPDPDDAEDVAQVVLLRLTTQLDRFDHRSRFETWLYRVTKNVALMSVRRDRRREGLLASHSVLVVPYETEDRSEETARLASLVRAYLDELTDRQRQVFMMADVQGMNSTEIGKRLGISPNTVRGVLRSARRTIRIRMLQEHAALVEDLEL